MKTTKEMIEVMQACERGEQIEFCYTDEVIKVWQDTNGKPLWNWGDTDYRVKPKPKYVPFETPEEFLTALRKHGYGLIGIYNDEVLKSHNISIRHDGLVYDHTEKEDGSDCSYVGYLQELFIEYKMADGTPCGKEVDV